MGRSTTQMLTPSLRRVVKHSRAVLLDRPFRAICRVQEANMPMAKPRCCPPNEISNRAIHVLCCSCLAYSAASFAARFFAHNAIRPSVPCAVVPRFVAAQRAVSVNWQGPIALEARQRKSSPIGLGVKS